MRLPVFRANSVTWLRKEIMGLLDHEKLDVYQQALTFVVTAFEIAAALPGKRGDLGDQLRRASTSIALNIAEGAGEFAPSEKARFYRIARRSAVECAAILDIAGRLGFLPTSHARAREDLVRLVGGTVRLIQSCERRSVGSVGPSDNHAGGWR
jgi:four helix bundle protein